MLAHNRDEEKEHAAMALEWLRRNDPVLDRQLREWLFTDKTIGVDGAGSEAPADDGGTADSPSTTTVAPGSLGVGALYGKGTL